MQEINTVYVAPLEHFDCLIYGTTLKCILGVLAKLTALRLMHSRFPILSSPKPARMHLGRKTIDHAPEGQVVLVLGLLQWLCAASDPRRAFLWPPLRTLPC